MATLVNKSVSVTSASGSTHTFTTAALHFTAAESNTTEGEEVQRSIKVTATFTGDAEDWDATAEASLINRIAAELSIEPSRVKIEAVFQGSIVVLFVIDNPPPPTFSPTVVLTPTPASDDNVVVLVTVIVVSAAFFLVSSLRASSK